MDAFAAGTTVALAVLAGAFVVGARVIGRKMEERFALLAPPLCAEIAGTAHNFTVSGTYAGAPVRARIVARDDDGTTTCHYELTRDGDAGSADWTVRYAASTGWTVRCDDAGLTDEVRRAGALSALERWPTFPRLQYTARERRITYCEQVADRFAFPDAATFRDQLELLERFAALGAGSLAR